MSLYCSTFSIQGERYVLACSAHIRPKIYETGRGSNKERNINHVGQHTPFGIRGGAADGEEATARGDAVRTPPFLPGRRLTGDAECIEAYPAEARRVPGSSLATRGLQAKKAGLRTSPREGRARRRPRWPPASERPPATPRAFAGDTRRWRRKSNLRRVLTKPFWRRFARRRGGGWRPTCRGGHGSQLLISAACLLVIE